MKMLSAAGNIWFASMPMPNAIFCPSGIPLVCIVFVISPEILFLVGKMLAMRVKGAPAKPVNGAFFAISGL